MTTLKPYVLRYWEGEFAELKPAKNRAGNRIYRSNDIKIVLLIRKLLYTDKYTIEGAKQKLNMLITNNNQQLDFAFHKNIETIIVSIKEELVKILKILETK